MESDASESCEEEDGNGNWVSLELRHLESLFDLNDSPNESTIAMNGRNPRRLKTLLAHPPCACQCRVPFGILTKICSSFWSLRKESQDAVLWSLQSRTRAGTAWHIEGTWFLIDIKSMDSITVDTCFISLRP